MKSDDKDITSYHTSNIFFFYIKRALAKEKQNYI